ncbi:hypothetical protein C2G38_2181022 [Gigaspora rosea]|uniref:Uncharacterized protein n=1 Tax=Gigaspora rosea TaxID=44941 RepID=A0A397VCI6_9GLOM|nr:hypothetical protein C2G38_2181022 [Gigaspora rosea]
MLTGLDIIPLTLTKKRDIVAYQWSNHAENFSEQQDQILEYLNKHLNSHSPENLVIFDVSGLRNFLNVTNNPLLPFNVRGGMDLILVEESAVICEMISTNFHVHDGIKVFGILTDLNKTWNIYWIEEKHIKTLALNNRENTMRYMYGSPNDVIEEMDVICDDEDEYFDLKMRMVAYFRGLLIFGTLRQVAVINLYHAADWLSHIIYNFINRPNPT